MADQRGSITNTMLQFDIAFYFYLVLTNLSSFALALAFRVVLAVFSTEKHELIHVFATVHKTSFQEKTTIT